MFFVGHNDPRRSEARSRDTLKWAKAHFSAMKTRILLSFALLLVLATLAYWRWAGLRRSEKLTSCSSEK